MGVKLGYAKTVTKVVPERWTVRSLGDLFDFSGGLSRSRDDLGREGYCYLHYGDIHISAKSWVDLDSEYDSLPKLDISLSRVATKSLLKDGDVVFVDASEDDEGTSKHWAVTNRSSRPFIAGLHTMVAKSRTDELDNGFKRYCFQSRQIKEQFITFAVGTKVSGVNKTNVKKIQLVFPMRPQEQRAIAAALSDVDALISLLDQLIAKKRDLKHATMQQLLTGKTRLPGFRRAWVVKKLGDLFDFSGGLSRSRDDLGREGYCYLHYGDIHISAKSWVDLDSEYDSLPKLDISLSRVATKSLLKDGDVVFVDASEDDEGTSKHWVVSNRSSRPFISGLHTMVAKSRNAELDNGFKRYCFQSRPIKEQFVTYAVGTKVSGVNKSNVKKIELRYPEDLSEQTAIAQILSDMDAEITALEACRDKTKSLKQGMMQELLTGRIRLV